MRKALGVGVAAYIRAASGHGAGPGRAPAPRVWHAVLGEIG